MTKTWHEALNGERTRVLRPGIPAPVVEIVANGVACAAQSNTDLVGSAAGTILTDAEIRASLSSQ
jgi:hypothetical protein